MAQNFGNNTALNQQLASTFGYTGDFGGGQWGDWASANLTPYQQSMATNMHNAYMTSPTNLNDNPQNWTTQQQQDFGNQLTTGSYTPYGGTQNFGANPALNQQLASTFGYTGDFGGGQWADWASQNLSPQQKQQVDWIRFGGSNTPGTFGTGGDGSTTAQPGYLGMWDQAMGGVQDLYGAGAPPYQSSYVGPTPGMQGAISGAYQNAQNASDNLNAIGSYAGSTMGGQYLYGNPVFGNLDQMASGGLLDGNPHLDQVYSRVADEVQDRVNQQFAGSNRTGSGYHADVMTRGLADAYSDMLMQDYAQQQANMLTANSLQSQAFGSERGLMNQAASIGTNAVNSSLAPTQLALTAAQQEQMFAEQQRADQNAQAVYPWSSQGANIDAYLARLQGVPGGTTSQNPYDENDWLTALGYAQTGANIFGSPWGALAGGLAFL
jgi:hypothetical protein